MTTTQTRGCVAGRPVESHSGAGETFSRDPRYYLPLDGPGRRTVTAMIERQQNHF